MFRFAQRETKILVDIHGWSATILGFLLYAVVFTGTVAVLALEIGHWSVATPEDKNPFAHEINDIVNGLSKKVGRAYREDVSLSRDTVGNLSIYFHKTVRRANGLNRDRGVQFKVDVKTGEVLSRREGYGTDLFRTDQDGTLERFIVDTHVRLYLPRPWGLIVTGILGMVMMIAAITGLFMHRHLLRDAFTLRTHSNALLNARDRHTVAASWGLPYAFLLSLTGCFFSFALSFGIPAMALVAFGGNIEQLERTIMGTELQRPGRRIQTGNLDQMIADATRRAGTVPRSVQIEYFGRKNAKVTTQHLPNYGELEGKSFLYRGLDGTFVRQLPSVGQVPSFGGALVSIIGPLHFGNFAGLLSKVIWMALGFSCCYVIFTGLNLWVQRRENAGGWQFFGRFVDVFAIGLPLSIAGAAHAFFLFKGSDKVLDATPLGFVVVASIAVSLAFLLARRHLSTFLWGALAISLLLLPVTRFLSGGVDWSDALAHGATNVVALDLLLIFCGLACAWQMQRRFTEEPLKTADHTVAETRA